MFMPSTHTCAGRRASRAWGHGASWLPTGWGWAGGGWRGSSWGASRLACSSCPGWLKSSISLWVVEIKTYLVQLTNGWLLGRVDDGQGARDGLAHVTDAAELGWSAGAGDLGDAEVVELLLVLVKLLGQLVLGLAFQLGDLLNGHLVRLGLIWSMEKLRQLAKLFTGWNRES